MDYSPETDPKRPNLSRVVNRFIDKQSKARQYSFKEIPKSLFKTSSQSLWSTVDPNLSFHSTLGRSYADSPETFMTESYVYKPESAVQKPVFKQTKLTLHKLAVAIDNFEVRKGITFNSAKVTPLVSRLKAPETILPVYSSIERRGNANFS
jgi:hypothetical protein